MNRFYRFLNMLLIGFIIVNMAACVSSAPAVIANSDEDMDSGLGGTGMTTAIASVSDEDRDSGLGGTGIVGVITGFGSIFVNGIEVEYDDTTELTIDGKKATERRLQIGDVVEVLTVDNRLHTHASRINLRHEVIGVVESVEADSFSFTVKGQSIVQAVNNVAMPETGQVVAVSGFRIDENTVLATRVTPATGAAELLRLQQRLPFADKVSRWRVQTFVKNRKAIFYLDKAERVVSVDARQKNTLAERLGIKVLQLQRSGSDQLQLRGIIEQSDMPRGRQTFGDAHSPDNKGLLKNGWGYKPGGSVDGGINSPYGATGVGSGMTPGAGSGRLLDQGTGSTGGSTPGTIR